MLANKETGSVYGDPAPQTAVGQDLCGTVKGLQQGRGLKPKEDGFSLDIGKNFLTVRVVQHWDRLPREAVISPSLDVFTARQKQL